MKNPFLGAFMRLFTARKPGESLPARIWASHRAERLVKTHGTDTAVAIARVAGALCADLPTADVLLPAPRKPLDDEIRRVIVVGDLKVDNAQDPDGAEPKAIAGGDAPGG